MQAYHAHNRKDTEYRMIADVALLNQITCGDSRVLSARIPDESVDLVFCDPPYLRANIEDGIYEWLAEESLRVLKPGGYCLAYVGTMWKQIVMQQMSKHLAYHWDFISFTTGYGTMIWSHHVIARHKSILAYVKGSGKPRMNTLSVWTGGGKDKRYHRWGQDGSTGAYYIQCFASPNALVYDPFCGGGTVPSICKQIGRDFIAFEIDEDIASIARQRLAETQMPLPGLGYEQSTVWDGIA
jgi:tRNA G10  N-methylase Trm11